MSLPVACFAKRSNGVLVGLEIAQRVRLRTRSLAEHVVGIKVAFRGHRPAALHGLGDGAAEHELLSHLAHRRRDCRADHRLAQPPHHRAQGAVDAALALVEHAAGQHQRPGRGIDENRGGAAGMRRPVLRRDLVADQFVHRLGVGHAQQRLGKAHQCNALLGREAVGGEEHLHQPRIGRTAHSAHQLGGMFRDGLPLRLAEVRACDQTLQRCVFIRQDSWRGFQLRRAASVGMRLSENSGDLQDGNVSQPWQKAEPKNCVTRAK